jgi:Tol biopolymer transport system component
MNTIWRARLDGTQATQLASGDVPAVSPDGRFVAFGRGADVLMMPAAGGAAQRVYTFTAERAGLYSAPTWAPDSKHLAFAESRGVVVLNVISRAAHVVPADDGDAFAFSPDSRRIVFSVNGDLYVIPVRGGTPAQLTHDHKSDAPVWGKPGIAFVRSTHGLSSNIWLIAGANHRIRQLSHNLKGASPVAFSADGKELLAAHWPDHDGRMWAINVAGGRQRTITRWMDVAPQGLSADGTKVLAVLGCGGNGPIYGAVETIPFAGGKPHIVVNGPCGASWNAR